MSPAHSFQNQEAVLQEIRRGGRCAILVEGEEQKGDAALLQFILREVTTQVTFFGRDGRPGLLKELKAMLEQLPAESLWAIVDRDFESDDPVELTYQADYQGHEFFWRRFTIENYLLEPAWIAEAIHEFYALEPGRIPTALKTEVAIEKFLLDWARRLNPQIAGNATIADLSVECGRRAVPIQGRTYFVEAYERDSSHVRTQLITHYSGGAELAPDALSVDALSRRYEEKLQMLQDSTQSLTNMHKFISGKLLLKALYQELPKGSKPQADHLLGKLATHASKLVPDDIQTLIVERILPRWRSARS